MSNNSPASTPPATQPDFEIRDPAISTTDAASIMQEIRERIRKRSEEAEANGQRYALPEEAATYKPLRESDNSHSGMRLALERLRGASSGMFVQLSVVQKKPWPILGPLLLRARTAIHQLVLYYVGALASRQAAVNRASLDAFQQMTYELSQANKRIEQLEQQIKAVGPSSQPPK